MTGTTTTRRRVRLAPLEPDAFFAWGWLITPRHERGPSPLTLDDVWFEFARLDPELKLGELRRDFVRIAARVRANQRLGLEPWSSI